MKVKEHYDKHLGNFYSWMIGDFQEKVDEQIEILKSVKIDPFYNKIAVDLGAGNGVQSIALASLGFNIKAVDFNKQLLTELLNNKGPFNIEIYENDIIAYLNTLKEKVELIVCMGDTLTHLQNKQAVNNLINQISSKLITGGKVVFSFRDLTYELKDEERFITVRGDENRILTCFLEYFEDHVMVFDLLHEREDGKWQQRISSYPKLRLSEKYIRDILESNNFRITHNQLINRMIYIVGEKNY
jgi:predicted TPR repeat methyltransferase